MKIGCSNSSSSHAAVLFATAGMGSVVAQATVLAPGPKTSEYAGSFKDIFALSSLFIILPPKNRRYAASILAGPLPCSAPRREKKSSTSSFHCLSKTSHGPVFFVSAGDVLSTFILYDLRSITKQRCSLSATSATSAISVTSTTSATCWGTLALTSPREGRIEENTT